MPAFYCTAEFLTPCSSLYSRRPYYILLLVLLLDATAFSLARFGQGTGPIQLDEVRCVGTETMLGDCPANPIGVNDCSHVEDAGVGCQSKQFANFYLLT